MCMCVCMCVCGLARCHLVRPSIMRSSRFLPSGHIVSTHICRAACTHTYLCMYLNARRVFACVCVCIEYLLVYASFSTCSALLLHFWLLLLLLFVCVLSHFFAILRPSALQLIRERAQKYT